ncbi:dihydrofolate reductase [Bacillus sp. KH172YL63]|uniref:dihydrofolate reductase n=1 Tax=Bacillus sp. KH172YL63 TaxID=2709784 RepID=UPI0013E522DA|nr:dihydrofolate reductase [Bacillus sp. KH172YL63]BCB04439.1 dihydrofolate reductase [Bacillus sp. KH172YL63]
MLSFIVAMDKNQVIGINNELPWRLPADLAFFKKTTMGQPIIMGRKTFESIGKVLPGRENIIVTRDTDYSKDGCTVIHSIEDIKRINANTDEELFVIGGAEIFNATFDSADRLYITLIDEEFEGDTYFPELDPNEWKVISKEKGMKNEQNPYDYYFIVYDRINR